MDKKAIAVITERDSDLLDLMKYSKIVFKVIKPDEITACDLDDYCSIMIIGGVNEKGLQLFPKEAALINEQILKGKKVFSEFCYGAGQVYLTDIRSTRYERPVFVSDDMKIDGLKEGDIFDEQCNMRMNLWRATYKGRPLLQYVRNVEGYYSAEVKDEILQDRTCSALWFQEHNLLVCAFRMADFIKARFSPIEKWKDLIKFIIEWISGEKADFDLLAESYNDIYHFEKYDEAKPFEEQIKACLDDAINWFFDADMLIQRYGGYYGVKEGMGPAVYADGQQQVMETLRPDCVGETSLAFFMNHLVNKDKQSLNVADGLMSFFNDLQIKTDCFFKGMNGNLICYQDENAMGLLLTALFRCLYTGKTENLDMCIDVMKFLVGTTGTDGLRVVRTDIAGLFDEMIDGMNLESYEDEGYTKWKWGFFRKNIHELSREPGNVPSAHYNGFYLATLLLAYKLTKIEEFKTVGIKGMESLMSIYPFTAREQSETEELCRLVLPLSMLYWVTGEEKHKDWLYMVVKDLQKMKHSSGAYVEWDTGYTAVSSKKKDNECSVLANNGDPVADLLYSINWLPIGLMQAYFVTGDQYFKGLWEETARFFISTQVKSKNKQLHGAWTRAVDVELMEVFGVPNDIGWAPWSIESGWTVAEIAAGLAMGMLADTL